MSSVREPTTPGFRDMNRNSIDDSELIPLARSTKPPTFKVVGSMVMAMKKFQNALNPTYEYGKRKSSSGDGSEMAEGPSSRVLSGRTPSGRPISSGRTSVPGAQHGFKGNLLFKPLPDPPAHHWTGIHTAINWPCWLSLCPSRCYYTASVSK